MLLIPIGHEDQKVTRLPWVTIGLVAANVAVFLVTLPIAERQATETRLRVREVVRFARGHPYLRLPKELAEAVPARRPPADLPAEVLTAEQARLDRLWNELQATASGSVYRTYGYVPARPGLFPLFTSMFMHGGWLHLIGNMLFLWLAGATLEDRWGRVLFPGLYLASGIVGTMAHGAVYPRSDIPLVGASGAIAGLMGAFLIRLAATRIRFFYWFWFLFFVRWGTFDAPAYVVLPLWLLQQFAMASVGERGGVAVWAHIGGFGLGAAAALLIRATDLEARVLAPAIQKKITWTPSEGLAAALGRLDRGDADGAIKDLEALLRTRPGSIDARTALIAAYARKGDRAGAGRESGRLVGGYLKARDMAGAMAASREHRHAYPDVPLAIRDQLALAAYCEEVQEYQEAADLFRDAVAAWPDDPLAPKALVDYGRLKLHIFKRPEDALEFLERARAHPRATPEIQRASAEMIAAAREALRPAWERREAPSHEEPAGAVPAILLGRRVVPVPMRAVGIDARGLHLQGRGGRTGRLAWQQVAAISVASIGGLDAADRVAGLLILDLLMVPGSTPAGAEIRCIRLSIQDLAIPQLQGEPSPLRAFQRLVATILKATGAAAYPSREACLGLHGFPAFPDLEAYEADLLSRLAAPA